MELSNNDRSSTNNNINNRRYNDDEDSQPRRRRRDDCLDREQGATTTTTSEATAAATRRKLVHAAIQNGEWHALPQLVAGRGNNAAIWWQGNACGWTAVHFAASQFLPLPWWNWILQRATTATTATKTSMYDADTKKRIVMLQQQRNHEGQTVAEITVQTLVRPLPWQTVAVQTAARRARKAMAMVLTAVATQPANHKERLLDWIRKRVQETIQQVDHDCRGGPDDSPFLAWFTAASRVNSNENDNENDDNLNNNNNNNHAIPIMLMEHCVRVVSVLQILAKHLATGNNSSSTTRTTSTTTTNGMQQESSSCSGLSLMHLLSQCNNNNNNTNNNAANDDALLARFLYHLYPPNATTTAWLLHAYTHDKDTVLRHTHPWEAPVPAWLSELLAVPNNNNNNINNIATTTTTTTNPMNNSRAGSCPYHSSSYYYAAVATGKPLATLQFLSRPPTRGVGSSWTTRHDDDNTTDGRLLLTALIQRGCRLEKDPILQQTALYRARLTLGSSNHLHHNHNNGSSSLGSIVYHLLPVARQDAARRDAWQTLQCEELSIVYTIVRYNVSWLWACGEWG